MTKTQIGNALDSLTTDVIATVIDLVRQYRAFGLVGALKQGVDTPHRARIQVTAWMADYNARNGSGAAAFLASCLTAAGSTKTLSTIDAALATVESQCLVLVNHVKNDAWTFDQVAAAIEAQVPKPVVELLSFGQLPIPANYTTVWGEPW
ncbi:MAG: hypothetical protein ABI640_12870 [Gammaproteobacteria bacterium]